MVGRKTSTSDFFANWSRTIFSWRERVQRANQWDSKRFQISDFGLLICLRRGCRRRRLLQADLVRFLDLVVLPVDDRLGAHLLDKFQVLALALAAGDLVGDVAARVLE